MLYDKKNAIREKIWDSLKTKDLNPQNYNYICLSNDFIIDKFEESAKFKVPNLPIGKLRALMGKTYIGFLQFIPKQQAGWPGSAMQLSVEQFREALRRAASTAVW